MAEGKKKLVTAIITFGEGREIDVKMDGVENVNPGKLNRAGQLLHKEFRRQRAIAAQKRNVAADEANKKAEKEAQEKLEAELKAEKEAEEKAKKEAESKANTET